MGNILHGLVLKPVYLKGQYLDGPLLFLIYIINLSDDSTTNVKLFPDDTSLFPIAYNVNTSITNNDLNKIKNWVI